jgi:SAM-dependent methyltransferase
MQQASVRPQRRALILETSPRLGPAYQKAMKRWFYYLFSDYDQRAHSAALHLDLQKIDLPDSILDIILTPHVLEHIPDTERALSELRRILVPEGQMFLQVPVLQGETSTPSTPEFHGDNTPVFWRFGFDLTDRLRAHGFSVSLLCTQPMLDAVRSASVPEDWPRSPEFNVNDMVSSARASDLKSIASQDAAAQHAFSPPYMFLTWHCVAV